MGRGDAIVIDDLAALKAIADPLRHRMVDLLQQPRTVKELAKKLRRPPDRLYYHLGLLERHGIVQAVERRGAERRYQAAGEITLAPGLNVPPAAVQSVVGGLLEEVGREYAAAGRRTRDDGVKRSMLGLLKLRLTEDQRAELTERLNSLAEEYAHAEDHSVDDDGRREYGVITGIWPVVDE